MQDNPFDEIKKILSLREKGIITQDEAAKLLEIVEHQFLSQTQDKKNSENLVKTYEESDESLRDQKNKLNQEKPKRFGDDDNTIENTSAPKKEERKTTDHQQNRFHSEDKNPFLNNNGSFFRDKINISFVKNHKVLLLLFGSLLLLSFSFFSLYPAFLWDSDGDGFHTYREDACPDVFGVISGCPDQDNDGVADHQDHCPTVFGTIDGCPDKDGDGVPDVIDECDTLIGKKEDKGCPPKTTVEKPNNTEEDYQRNNTDSDKLKNGKAVLTPKTGKFIQQAMAGKWLRFNNNHFEYSDFENKQFKPISSDKTLKLLNDYYQLKGTLTGNSQDSNGSSTKNSQNTQKNETKKKPTTDPSKPKLTSQEQADLKALKEKAKKEALTYKETLMKNELEQKQK